MRGRGDTASTDIRESAEGAQRTEQARLHAVMRSACGGHIGLSSSTRELCERWLPQAAIASEARACRRDGAQTGQRAGPACTQRASKPLCTPPAVDSASPPRFLARVLEGEQVLEHAQHARPARPARRHTRATRSPRRAARTARLEQQEQLEKQPSLCRSSMPSLHTEILWPCWPVCVPARPAHAHDESDGAAHAGDGSSCRTQPAAAAAACRAGAGNSGRHSIFRATTDICLFVCCKGFERKCVRI